MGRMISRSVMLCVLLMGCRKTGSSRVQTPKTPGSAVADSAPGVDARPVIVFLGTSLTAGLGVGVDSAFPAVIQRKLDSLHLDWRVQNAGVSGETSAGALRRVSWLLQQEIALLVLETGANERLRGLDVDST